MFSPFSIMLVTMKGSRKVSVNCSRVWMVFRASSTTSGLNRLASRMVMNAATAAAYLNTHVNVSLFIITRNLVCASSKLMGLGMSASVTKLGMSPLATWP